MAYFSVLSAYLLVAYLVGARLTRLQTSVITGLYLVMQLFLVWGTAGYFYVGRSFSEQAESIVAGGVIDIVKPHHLAIVLLTVGVFAGLKFMWDLRHTETE